jgi:hypothetical protein
MKILVTDDSKMARKMVIKTLQDALMIKIMNFRSSKWSREC